MALAMIAGDGAAEVIVGSGAAPVGRDAETVRVLAERAARRDIAHAMARQLLGAERIGEVDDAMLDRLAGQIRDDMIVDRSAERAGREFRVSLSADIDRAWFQQRLDDEGVRSSAGQANAATQRILVMLDESVGPALDASQPAESTTLRVRDSGFAAADRSSLSYSERERAATAYDSSRSSGVAGSSSSGYVSPYGAGASRTSVAAASSARDRGAAAYGRDENLEVRNDVSVAAHNFAMDYEHVVYQATATTQAGQTAVAALTSELIRYDISTSNATAALSRFRPGPAMLFTDLQANGDLAAFMDYANGAASAPFLMGGQMAIVNSGRQPATGYATCTGSLRAQAFATATGADIGAAASSAEMAASTYELCASRLAESLAQQAAETLGPQIQRYWRTASRGVASAMDASSGPAEYTLTVRGHNLSMGDQADILDALQGLNGVSQHAFLNQASGQISFQVRYEGSTPLHLALYQRLRANARFAQAASQAEGRSVLMCLDGC